MTQQYPFLRYDLPPDRIAQHPMAERAQARLLAARRSPALELSDLHVTDLPGLLREGDLLVVNNTRVIPARFFFPHRDSEMEILIVGPVAASGEWEAMARPMKRAKEGEELHLSPRLRATVLGRNESGDRLRLQLNALDGTVVDVIREEGTMPIPGYIRGGRAGGDDRARYQTVFAKHDGSVAAPTAGLHLPEIFQALVARGVRTAEITLHVGPASFVPVRDENQIELSTESYLVPRETLSMIDETKLSGGRVIAVGTTTTRCLESFARLEAIPAEGELLTTKLFIRPGFQFRVVDVLMTNFHQPETTHLLLVAAFFGAENMEKVYRHALASGYRFLSYGDSMLLDPGAP